MGRLPIQEDTQVLFPCEMIRRGGRGCSKGEPRRLQGDDSNPQFGPWLRASSHKPWSGREMSRIKRDHGTPEVSGRSSGDDHLSGDCHRRFNEGKHFKEESWSENEGSPATLPTQLMRPMC